MRQTSGLSGFFESTGWPAGQFKDTDAIFETEKQLTHSFPIRNVSLLSEYLCRFGSQNEVSKLEQTDVSIIEHAAKRGMTSFVVVPSLVCECPQKINGTPAI